MEISTEDKAKLVYLEFKDALGYFTNNSDVKKASIKHLELMKNQMQKVYIDEKLNEIDAMIEIIKNYTKE
jgi:hypothetical protein